MKKTSVFFILLFLKRVLRNKKMYVIMQMKIENIEEGNTDVEVNFHKKKIRRRL